MTELSIKVEPESAREFKKISQNVFQGNDSQTFQQAVQLLRLLQVENSFERFWKTAGQIRKKIERAGGLSEKEIDRLVLESRARRNKTAI